MNTRTPLLEIQNLHVAVEDREILRGVDLTVGEGEIHALMGPNGSGKSTLASALLGHPKYVVTEGRIRFRGEDVTSLTTDERARRGLFLAFQYPVAIPGVTLGNYLRVAVKNVRGNGMTAMQFRRELKAKMDLLKMDPTFATRYVNEGFSGGEKKRTEILQLAMLEPKVAVLDETDSGLDIDALRTVSEAVNAIARPQGAPTDMGVLIITHYQRILNYVRPDFVHVLVRGRIVESGGPELVERLEREGYEPYLAAAGEGNDGERINGEV